MSYTLLLDLDDTLLINPITGFLPAYLQALSSHLAPYADPELIVKSLLGGTRRMIANQQPDCTLEEVFADYFYNALGIPPQALEQPIDQFYTEVYPALKSITAPHPHAVQLVESAVQRGYRLVIATNPLFPRTAIVQRLAWAGLSPEKYPFALIPSMEAIHFAKPNPALFAELLAQLGWPDGPVIMVGNDFQNDIAPALELGFSAYWVSNGSLSPPSGSYAPSASGDLRGLLPWLDSMPIATLQSNFNTPSAQVAILRSTPAALDQFCRRLDATAWSRRPASDEWCPTEIVCHMRDVDREVNMQRVEKVLSQDNPFLPGEDTGPWAEQRNYIEQDGRNALLRFSAARRRLLDLLLSLSPQDWLRPARHAIFGPTTLQEIVTIITAHDRLHLRQISQAIQAASASRRESLSGE
ncbi:MAG TPA: DinB family protein [Anaerolineales bacterium]|nr:DinB family protein [Anaerolineales bacterium]